MIDLEEDARDVARIDLQRGFEVFREGGAGRFPFGPGESPEQVRIFRVFLQSVGEGLRRQREVMFVQGELPAGEVAVHEIGIGFSGWVQQAFQHHFGICSEVKGHPGEHDQAGGIAEGSGAAGDEILDAIEGRTGLLGMSGGQGRFPGEPVNANAS